MFQIIFRRTTSGDPDFIELVRQLDAYLTITDGDEHAFYDQYNKLHNIRHVVVAYAGDSAIGCGAIKELKEGVMEVKRMYTQPDWRGRGVASQLLKQLEQWAAELGYHTCMLETGKRQAEAIQLYLKNGYKVIANYGQYQGVENSVCFEKKL